MTVFEVLEGARELVLKGWCQGAYARDVDGRKCDEISDRAVRWCLIGALRRASGGSVADTPGVFGDALHECYRAHYRRGGMSMVSWHDAQETTVSDVVAFVDLVCARVGVVV